MPDTHSDKAEKKPAVKKKDRAAEIANTFEWLITAFILAFVFRAFVMEAFRIPTGSMADTLKGAHFRLRCPQCGYEYDHGFVPQSYGLPDDTVPPGAVPIRQQTRCPSCGFFTPAGEEVPVANGDRILVLKCIYQFVEPKRWDVIVFKNPVTPTENYIKRLIGLPGETIEIIDGDICIDGLIARKPPEVQRELWMPVYDHDFQPVNPNERTGFNGHHWQSPFNLEGSAWKIDEADPTRLVLDSPAEQTSTLTYGAPSANGFAATYAYNEVHGYSRMPACSDLMVRFYVRPVSFAGGVGITLRKQGIDYQARLDLSGRMTLSRIDHGQETILATREASPPRPKVFTLVKFANVDHQLLFEYDGQDLSFDLGRSPKGPPRGADVPPRAEIFGCGQLTLAHIALFRDVYYTSDGQGGRGGRVIEGRPFSLNADEFFVLGDNSPNSEDGRWWGQPDMANRGWEPPRAGVVPRYYLVGKALFVYWPSGFDFPWPASLKASLLENSRRNRALRLVNALVSLRWIPNVGQMRFIYGGTDRTARSPSGVEGDNVIAVDRGTK
ncbi:MAG: signal peptidase I [Planctomycetes bacterium]|jgi:signal peptidase I|nr:signal peptidase I [Planctomycetota bacterium]